MKEGPNPKSYCMKWAFLFILLITNISNAAECTDCNAVPTFKSYQGPNIPNYHEKLMALLTDPNFPKQDFANIDLDNSDSLIKDYDKGIKMLLQHLPDSSVKDGLQQYLEIIQAKSYASDATVGASNPGLSSFHFNSLQSNSCFANLAEAFYTEIFEMDSLQNNNNQGPDMNLSLESGKGAHKDLNPGWLYDKAMTYTGGDSNLALNLIALCGHDDTAQGELSYKMDKESNISSSKNDFMAIINGLIQITESNIKLQNDSQNILNESAKKYLEDLKIYKEKLITGEVNPVIKNQIQRNIICPNKSSNFYLSKALGSNVDLSEEDKNRIAAIQAPNKGRMALPSKNYHFIASAFMACQLISKGINPKMAVIIQKMAGWAYRTIRINEDLRRDLNDLEKLEKLYEQYLADFSKKNLEKIKTSRGTRLSLKESPISIDQWIISVKDSLPQTFYYFGDPRSLEPSNLKKWFIRLSAARELSKMTIGGKILGQEAPFTNISLNFINDPITRHISGIDKDLRGRSRSNISTNAQAQEKALTYLIDWDWTTKQHEIGAQFAAEKCEKKPIHFKPDDKLCDTLATRPGITCKINFNEEILLPIEVGGDESLGSSVLSLAKSLEDISDQLNEQYLTPNLDVTNQDGDIVFSGLY